MTDYDPEETGHCPGCGTGLARGERCPWRDCSRYGRTAGEDGRMAPGLAAGTARRITREQAAQLIYDETGSLAHAAVPMHGAPAQRANLDADTAYDILERRAWLDFLEAVEFLHENAP